MESHPESVGPPQRRLSRRLLLASASAAAAGALWYGNSATGFVRFGASQPEKLAQLLPPMLGPGKCDLLGIRNGQMYLFHSAAGTILAVPLSGAHSPPRVAARPLALSGAAGLGLLGDNAVLLSPWYLPHGAHGSGVESYASRLWSVPLEGGEPHDMGFPPLERGSAWMTSSACFGIRAGQMPGPEIWVTDQDNTNPRATATMSLQRPWEYDRSHRLPGVVGTYFQLLNDGILYVPPNGGSMTAKLRSNARLVSEVDDRLLWAETDRMDSRQAEVVYSTRRDCTDPRVAFHVTAPDGGGYFLRSVVARGETWYGIVAEKSILSGNSGRDWLIKIHPYGKQPVEPLTSLPADRASERFDARGFYYVATEEQADGTALPSGLGVRRSTNLYRFPLPDR